MKKTAKITIVAALVILVAVVIALKQNRLSPIPSVTNRQLHRTKDTHRSKALPRLVDLGADKCIPCKMMAPILEELKKEYVGRLEVKFVDVWKKPSEAKEYGIKIIPTQIFFDASGKELFRHEGFFSKEDILTKWREFGVDLTKTK